MNDTEIYTYTLTNKFSDDYFSHKSYSGTIESAILHLIADMFSDDELQINCTQIICEDERKERIIQSRAMFFYFLNKYLAYSHFAICRKYGFHNINVGKLIKKHELAIEKEPFVFHIHKTIWNKCEILKETCMNEKGEYIIYKTKQERQIKKIENKLENILNRNTHD
jgi:MarR-like DNA-binding transcriptional regulator SgrR of sgrS sRNA